MAKGKAVDIEDNDDVDTSDVVQKFKDKVEKAESSGEKLAPRDDADDDEFEVSDDDDDEVESKPSRKERRRERGRLRDENDNLRNQMQTMYAELNQLKGMAATYPNPAMLQQLMQRQTQQQEDPLDAELKKVYSEQDRIAMSFRSREANAARQPFTDVELAEYRKALRDLEERKAELLYQRNARRHGSRQPDQQQALHQAVRTMNFMQNPDVYGNKAALQYADGVYKTFMARNPNANPKEVHDYSMTEARKAFGLQQPSKVGQAPTAIERHRYTGISKGGSAGKEQTSTKTITMTKELKKMADAALSHIKDDKQRYQTYANTIGKKVLEKRQQNG